MNLFWLLLQKFVPLFAFVIMGFIAGRWIRIQRESFARILIYLITPTVVFTVLLKTPIQIHFLSLPLLFFLMSSMICALFLKVSSVYFKSPAKNIIAFSAGNCNSGYFGLPAVMALFGEEALLYAIMISFGFTFFENTIGFYVTARGNYSAKQSLLRVLRLPSAYAFILAMTLNLSGVSLPPFLAEFSAHLRGAYTVLGMMLVGMGVSTLGRFPMDLKFIFLTFVAKFAVWPLIVFGVVYVDRSFFEVFPTLIHKIMILFAFFPMAANTVAFATELNAEPEKASVAVLLSTLVALLLVPAMSVWLSGLGI